MISEVIQAILAAQLAVGLGVLGVFLLRLPVRLWLGPRLAFGLWALPVVLGLAVLAPGPIQWAPATGLVQNSLAAAPPAPEPALQATVGDEPRAAGHGSGDTEALPRSNSLVSAGQTWLGLWGSGVVIMALILAIRQYRYHASLRPMQPALELGPDVYRAGSSAVGAGLVGAAKPKIVVPADFEQRFNAAERALILDHEREHRRAGHAQFNAIAALLQTLCWMNPLVHIGLRWFRLDQELACDAAIVQRSRQSARLYGAALLRAQTGTAAPFGCTWRPANGLKTRIKALGRSAPVSSTRWIGGAGLIALIVGSGTAGWAARPDIQAVEPSPALLVGGMGQPQGSSASGSLARVELRGVDGVLRIIAEARSDIAVEGLAANILTHRSGNAMIVEVSELTTDVCNQSGPVTQDFTLRVPIGAQLDVEGRMEASLASPSDVSLRARGCGTVELGDVQGALALELGGSVDVNGGQIEGAVTLDASGGPTLDLVRVGGPLQVRTAGGTSVDIEVVEAGGQVNLSGGSTLDVEEWTGLMRASIAGSSDADIEAVTSDEVTFSVSGAATGAIETGTIAELNIDQAANADFYFGGRAERSRVRNRGDAPVVIADPGELDSRGRVRTVADPPGD